MDMQRSQFSTDVTPGLVLHTAGPVPDTARHVVRELVNDLTEHAPRPVRAAKVKIKCDGDRDPTERSLAQATLTMPGTTLRAESVGEDSSDALSALGAILQGKLYHLDQPGRAPCRRARRPHFIEIEPDQRVVARHKTCSLTRIDSAQAIVRLAELDYRFYLFTDIADDKTTMVAHAGCRETTIQKIDGSPPDGPKAQGVRGILVPPPAGGVLDAVAELNSSGRDHFFFRDLGADGNGVASVLYRRYDGHYGVLVEARVTV